MELLLPSNLTLPSNGPGLILGALYSPGKYIIQNFIEAPDQDKESDCALYEHIYNHAREVIARLSGGINVLGGYFVDEKENNDWLKSSKKLRKESRIENEIVFAYFEDGQIRAKRLRDSGDVQKVEVKSVPSSKFFLTQVRSLASFQFNIPSKSRKLYASEVGKQITEYAVEKLANFELAVNDKFSDDCDLVIPKTVSTVPEKIDAEIYNENRDMPIKVSDCPHLNVSISIAVRVAITRRTAISDLKELIRIDVQRSLSKRFEIFTEDLILELDEDNPLMTNVILAKRVFSSINGGFPVSLYENFQTKAGDDLEFIFNISESTEPFEYAEPDVKNTVETDMPRDDDSEIYSSSSEKKAPFNNLENKNLILAILIVIIGIILSLLMSRSS
ncbi:unnamed protein product [Oikopleura dioica]|uniref:Protein odr-4 homolog n=1 Tax=Oikopleura dioica TaxID=34765 RepID=E4Y1A5_OIKDI|nr:unnamed protein product [Oikopleura dioica]